jgi:AraC-like DNA-binding protein
MDPRTASPGLAELGRRVGASERTLSRLFRDEVGMGYTVWRNHPRLHLATLVLAEGRLSPMQIEATNRRQDRLINAVRDRRSFRHSLLPSASPPDPWSGPPSAGRAASSWGG